MLFSSLIFLYAFLPIVIIANFLIKDAYKNRLLLIASLIFFAWGGVSYTFLLIISLIINYIAGLGIEKYKDTHKSKTILAIGIILNLLMLGVFKYTDFIVENLNLISQFFHWKLITKPGIILPLGISFYTFQAMSYIIDVYRKDTAVQKNFFKLALYIAFFPQLIAGPIVRYQLIAEQLSHRKNHATNLSFGIQRFILGLSKKVLLANQFGLVADQVFSISNNELNAPTAWIGIICYTLQIYFDFSGYSDMAIGLGRMFGFNLPENFNFPYISRSIREFWTRWHMTLSGWFKSYLYIPLGGSYQGEKRTLLNLLLVFFATAIWHGASWNFVVWGMLHGLFMIIERLFLSKLLNRVWKPLAHLYVLFVVVITWVFFSIDNIAQASSYCIQLFNFSNFDINEKLQELIYNKIFITTFIIGILSCTPFFSTLIKRIKVFQRGIKNHYAQFIFTNSKDLIKASLIILKTLHILGATKFKKTPTTQPFLIVWL